MTPVLPDAWRQRGGRVGFDWGPAGLDALVPDPSPHTLVVVVDVLSFSTAVVVGCGAGVLIRPAATTDGAVVAAREGALLALPRGCGGPSLSPDSLAGLAAGTRLVLPSPNGGAVSAAAGVRGAAVLAGAVRNATAAAAAVTRFLAGSADGTVAVIAAGERWPDGSLRPALEDLLGAGLVLAALPPALLSAEARAAAELARHLPLDVVADSASAREAVDRGFGQDVAAALALDASSTVPVLADGWFTAAAAVAP